MLRERIDPDEEILWILGRPNFYCASYAPYLRRLGIQIEKKAEAEQAAVILWMLNLYFQHGECWRDWAAELLKSVPPPPSPDVITEAGDNG